MSSQVSPFYHPSFLEVASRYFCFLRGAGAPLSPFVVSRRYFLFRTLELAGRGYADYRSILEPEDLNQLLLLHRARFSSHVIELDAIREEDPTNKMVQDWIAKQNLFSYQEDLSRAPYLPIDGSWEQYVAKKKRKFWYNISRAERLLEQQGGPITFQILEAAEEIAKALPHCLSLYRMNWNRLTSTSVYLTEQGLRFLQELLKNLPEKGMAELVLLKQADSLLAFAMGLKQGGVYYFYLFATNKAPQVATYSVGKILIRNLLKTVFERNFKIFDFMAGDEPYKYEWTKMSQGRSTYYVTTRNLPNRLRLWLLIALDRLVQIFKRTKWLRTLLSSIILLRKNASYRIANPKAV